MSNEIIPKTSVKKNAVEQFLKVKFEIQPLHIYPLKGGAVSQAFSYRHNNNDYVIRFNETDRGFEKDRFAHENFFSSTIPIPKVIEVGKFDDTYYFAISDKAQGEILDKFILSDAIIENEYDHILPRLVETFDEIHRIDVRQQGKYGDWNETGKAKFDSWKAFILNIIGDKEAKYPSLFEKSFLEKAVFNKLYGILEKLVYYCPEKLTLIHGDFGYDNVVALDGKITGVLDWELSKYGDFLYDVAWLSLWSGRYNFSKIFQDHYKKQRTQTLDYQERVLCYQIHIALGEMGWCAKNGEAKWHEYVWIRDKILSLADKA